MLINKLRDLAPRALLFFVVACLPSCVGVAHPLVEPAKAKPDHRLFGVWKGVSPEAPASQYEYLFIGRSDDVWSPRGFMKAVNVSNNSSNQITIEPLYFFPATIGQTCYAHLIDAKSSDTGALQWDASHPDVYLVKYGVEKDRLTVWGGMDRRAVESAISQGKLKGKVTERGSLRLERLQITESGEALSRFLADGGDKILFLDADKIVFERVK
jgi:hypothetical protein